MLGRLDPMEAVHLLPRIHACALRWRTPFLPHRTARCAPEASILPRRTQVPIATLQQALEAVVAAGRSPRPGPRRTVCSFHRVSSGSLRRARRSRMAAVVSASVGSAAAVACSAHHSRFTNGCKAARQPAHATCASLRTFQPIRRCGTRSGAAVFMGMLPVCRTATAPNCSSGSSGSSCNHNLSIFRSFRHKPFGN